MIAFVYNKRENRVMVKMFVIPVVLAFGMIFPATGVLAEGDPAAGEKAFRKCVACHSTEPGQHKIGPSLAGVYGTKAGEIEGFRFSPAMVKSNIVWDDETLDQYLENPRKYIPGNRMAFAGVRSVEERADLIAYMKTLK